jgi:ribosomal protein S27AE
MIIKDLDRPYVCLGPCERCGVVLAQFTLCPWCENGQIIAAREELRLRRADVNARRLALVPALKDAS